MAVQFVCPSCSNPIEIDDAWGGKQVACPYCHNTVTAPIESTYQPSAEIPMAQPGGYPPPAPLGYPPQQVAPAKTGNAIAVWALVLSISWLVISIGTSMIAAPAMLEAFGDTEPSMSDMQRYTQEKVQGGEIEPWLLVLMAGGCTSLLVWVGGLVCAIIALTRPARRKMTIVAFGFLALFPLQLVAGFLL